MWSSVAFGFATAAALTVSSGWFWEDAICSAVASGWRSAWDLTRWLLSLNARATCSAVALGFLNEWALTCQSSSLSALSMCSFVAKGCSIAFLLVTGSECFNSLSTCLGANALLARMAFGWTPSRWLSNISSICSGVVLGWSIWLWPLSL